MIDQIKLEILKQKLNLRDKIVLTEAASGHYCCTPFIAAMAGAKKVFAFVKDNRFATTEEVRAEFQKLNYKNYNIKIITSFDEVLDIPIDIVTNSGNLRPINSDIIELLTSKSVISLMYESWEFRSEDIDINFCKNKGIEIVAPFEFSSTLEFGNDLEKMMNFGLNQLNYKKSKIGLISNNNFKPQLLDRVDELVEISREIELDDIEYVVLARTAKENDDYLDFNFRKNQKIIQMWGNLNRERLLDSIEIYPAEAPKNNHMGVLPSDIGPDSVIKLQTSGLRVAQAYFEGNLENYGDYLLKDN